MDKIIAFDVLGDNAKINIGLRHIYTTFGILMANPSMPNICTLIKMSVNDAMFFFEKIPWEGIDYSFTLYISQISPIDNHTSGVISAAFKQPHFLHLRVYFNQPSYCILYFFTCEKAVLMVWE